MLFRKKTTLPSAAEVLPGRTTPIPTSERHLVLGTPLKGPYPDGTEIAYFGMGCFWGAERMFWQLGAAIYTTTGAQYELAQRSKAAFEAALGAKRIGPITTEIRPAPEFFFAEAYHQQYLHRNPGGYCGLAGTGVSCPIGLGAAAE